MNVLQAHQLFHNRGGNRDVFPGNFEIETPAGVGDIWPAAMVACVALAGMLEGCLDDTDLDQGIAHFQTLLAGGIVTQEQWDAETLNVLAEFMAAGEQQMRSMGGENSLN